MKNGIDNEIKKIKETLAFLESKIKSGKIKQGSKETDNSQQKKQQWEIEIKHLKRELDVFDSLFSLASDKDLEDLKKELKLLTLKTERLEKNVLLSGKYDKRAAILILQSGTGGRDAEDWTAMLLRMYQKWAENKGFKYRILFQRFGEPGGSEGRNGIKECSLEINGAFTYGLLKRETGVHRLVRISPFSAKQLRHTSFASVEVIPKISSTGKESIKINPEDLRIETFRASGPGGQYVNKRESAVRITHIPTGIKTESQIERLQGLNRKTALDMLISKLAQLAEKETEKEINNLKGKKTSPDFGRQIRSYILHPYKMVKDHRTGIETSNAEKVLNGDINIFIKAELRV